MRRGSHAGSPGMKLMIRMNIATEATVRASHAAITLIQDAGGMDLAYSSVPMPPFYPAPDTGQYNG